MDPVPWTTSSGGTPSSFDNPLAINPTMKSGIDASNLPVHTHKIMPEPGPKRPPVWGREMQPESIKMNARPGPLLKNQMPDVRNTLFSCIILIPLLLIFKPPAVDRYRRNKLNGNLP